MTLPHHAGITTNVNAPPVSATEWNAVIDTLNALSVTSSIVTICTSTTRPSSPGTGRLIYETDTLSIAMYNGSAWIYPDSLAPSCIALITSTQSWAAGPNVPLSWTSTERNDSYGGSPMWASGSPTIITIRKAGVYSLDASGAFTPNATGERTMYMLKNWNGSSSPTAAQIITYDSRPGSSSTSAYAGQGWGLSATRLFAANDTLTVAGFNGSGTTLTFGAGTIVTPQQFSVSFQES
jgi:hypothetical protein